jgi:hypothetical protein
MSSGPVFCSLFADKCDKEVRGNHTTFTSIKCTKLDILIMGTLFSSTITCLKGTHILLYITAESHHYQMLQYATVPLT